MGKRIGIMGGSFNPPHFGHLIAAQDAAEACGLDRVILVPAARSPHKLGKRMASAADRLAMVRLAVRGEGRFAASDVETRRGGISFTVDTLRQLKRMHPGDELFLIVGGDTVAEMHTWREAEAIAKLVTVVAVSRPGARRTAGGRKFIVRWVEAHAVDISATDIRRRVARGLSIRFLVPEGVSRYIARHGLYTT